MLNTNSGAGTVDPLAGLINVGSAPVAFGYYEQNATDAETITRCHDTRIGPVGWWNRHRLVGLGMGTMLVTTLGFLPAVQNALLTGLT